MSKPQKPQHLPSRGEFISFWKETTTDVGCGMGALYLVVWLGGSCALMLYVRLYLDHTDDYFVPSLIVAVAYFVAPIIYWVGAIPVYRRRYDRFLRCPQCRYRIDGDFYFQRKYRVPGGQPVPKWVPDPNWVIVSQTGRCPRCGAQLIALEQTPDNGDIEDE
jgi:DNA-directed RNA polymerase subunit RPC12/RpoP